MSERSLAPQRHLVQTPTELSDTPYIDSISMKFTTLLPVLSVMLLGNVVSPARAADEGVNQAWLVLMNNVSASTTFSGTGSDAVSTTVVPMQTLEGCQAEGNRWRNSKSKFRKGFREFYCVENK